VRLAPNLAMGTDAALNALDRWSPVDRTTRSSRACGITKMTIPVRGKLLRYEITGLSDTLPGSVPSSWLINVYLDETWTPGSADDPEETSYSGSTDSRIPLSVLNTALLTKERWRVELDIAENGAGRAAAFKRVRVLDNREDVCTGGGLPDPLRDPRLRPLSPTAFADEDPKKWGFFFASGHACGEYKGIDLDVYGVIEEAWLRGVHVILTIENNLIVDARIA
jgi:hypothetical protein